MAITDKEEGVWLLDEVYNKINEGGIWSYDATGGDQGKFYSWGGNGFGQGARNTSGNPTNVSSPVQVGTDATWSDFGMSGRKYAMGAALKGDGTLWAWGDNDFGQLGQNSKTKRSSPVQIGTGTDWQFLGFATQKWGAIKTDGTLWCCGRNNNGELGQNNKTYHSSPVQIPGTSWREISFSGFAAATKTDGSLWTWGAGNNGQLGHNNTSGYSSPKQVSGTTWNHAYCGEDSAYATKTDGTLWGFGRNDYGELGQNNRTGYSSPKQIPGTWGSGRMQIGQNYYAMSAIKSDGTLWSWGYNTGGNLGLNDTVFLSSPAQVPGTTWSNVDGGYLITAAMKTDATLWVWGAGYSGAFGTNHAYPDMRSSPIQLPGNWLNQAGSFSVNWDDMFALGS